MTPARVRTLLPAVAVVALDQITKAWAVGSLGGGRTVHVVWTLQFMLGYNSGMAFSKGTGLGPVIGVLATVAVVVMVASVRRAGSTMSALGMSLVIGGACGNLADRIFRGSGFLGGSVVDFIDFRWFPAFNVADSAITVGGVLVVLSMVLAGNAQTQEGTS